MTGLHLMQLEVEVSDIRWQYPLIIMCCFLSPKNFLEVEVSDISWRYPLIIMCCFLSQEKIALMKPKYGH